MSLLSVVEVSLVRLGLCALGADSRAQEGLVDAFNAREESLSKIFIWVQGSCCPACGSKRASGASPQS